MERPLDMVQLTLESVAHKLLELFQIKAPKNNQIRGEKMWHFRIPELTLKNKQRNKTLSSVS